jgi:hypothetical protein
MRVGLRARFASLRVERTRSADIREWEVHIHRFQWRPPGPRHDDPVSDEGLAFLDELVGALWFVIALPAAVVRSSRSRARRALFHWVTKTADGIRVTDVWQDRATFDRFAEEHIGPKMAEAGVDSQPDITFHEVHNHLTAG